MKTLNERYDYGLQLFLLSIDEGITGYRDDSLEVSFPCCYFLFILPPHRLPDRQTQSTTIRNAAKDSIL